MNMETKQIETEEPTDRAVSPVIGVILMVAITVILAAVIAAFVLDIGPSDTDPLASISVDGEGTSDISVTLESISQGDGIAVVYDGEAEASTTVTGDSIEATPGGGSEVTVVAYDGEDPVDHTDGDGIDDLEEADEVDIAVIQTIDSE